MCTAPRLAPATSSPFAPTTMSFTPSPSRSPMFSTDIPKESPLSSTGPFVVLSLISTVESTEPSVFINIMYAEPLLFPVHDTQSDSSAPTAISFTPSPFKSPMSATDPPNLSWLDSVGPFVVESLIFTVESTEPSVFINIMCTAPRLLPPSSLPFVPTTMSYTPSPSKSPMFSTDIPKK